MKVGIIGAGNIAANMAHTLNEMKKNGENAELYAIASRSLERAGVFAKKFNVPKVYGTYEELVNDKNVDLVYVATPHSHHFEHAKLALEAGKPTLVEKAFTANARQARELINISNNKKVFLAEAIWTRYLPIRGVIDELIPKIGEPTTVSAVLSYELMDIERLLKPELCGGATLDLGVYVINLGLMLFGHPAMIHSRSVLHESGVDVRTDINMAFSNGAVASLKCAVNAALPRNFTICGTNGVIICNDVNKSENAVFYAYENPAKPEIYEAKFEFTGFEYQVRACASALAQGLLEPPQMPHSEILKVMEIMDNVRKSSGVVYPFD